MSNLWTTACDPGFLGRIASMSGDETGQQYEFVDETPDGPPPPGGARSRYTTLRVNGEDVATAIHRRYEQFDGHGSVIDDISVGEEHRHKGHALRLLKHIHSLDPSGDLFATEFTEAGEGLRKKYEEETGKRYHDWSSDDEDS